MTSRSTRGTAPLCIPPPLAAALLRLYDYPDPRRPGRIIRGYDCPHALRTARMCAAVATRLGHPSDLVASFQIACLLHDLGRAGLDRVLFGKIWSWANRQGIATRPREWRAAHPRTRYGRETEAFLALHADELHAAGIVMDEWAREQVEMRLGFARRLTKRLRDAQPALKRLGVTWARWMQQVMLYYYYPEKLKGAPGWVRQLGEVLVAGEQFEAHSNRRRGADYYVRGQESVPDALAHLERLRSEGILSAPVVEALRAVAARGELDQLLVEARGGPLTRRDVRALRRALA